jgi:hypothetical protein
MKSPARPARGILKMLKVSWDAFAARQSGWVAIGFSAHPGSVAGLLFRKTMRRVLGNGQVGSQRAVVEPELLQDLAVVRVGGVQPGALGGQPPPHPSESRQEPLWRAPARAVPARPDSGRAGPSRPTRRTGAAAQQARGVDIGGFEDFGAVEGFGPAHERRTSGCRKNVFSFQSPFEGGAGNGHFGERRSALLGTRAIHRAARALLPAQRQGRRRAVAASRCAAGRP